VSKNVVRIRRRVIDEDYGYYVLVTLIRGRIFKRTLAKRTRYVPIEGDAREALTLAFQEAAGFAEELRRLATMYR
jgi:hypothetical protein